ncbi:MAG: hypothetical protein RL283_1676 [Actinomycetota bacterium]
MRAVELARTHRVTLSQTVTGTPHGDVRYHLTTRDGALVVAAGPASDPDVEFVQDWDTAVAVATGALGAQEAFISGRIRFSGDHQRLIDAAPLFAALDAAFDAVNARTRFA